MNSKNNNQDFSEIEEEIEKIDLNTIAGITGGITIYEEAFVEKNKLHNSKKTYVKLLDRLTKIKARINNQDPVKYLIYLYYIKKYSVEDISNHLSKDFKINWPMSSLLGEMKDFFRWEKRSVQEFSKTDIRRKKISDSQIWKKEEIEKKVFFILDCLGNGCFPTQSDDIDLSGIGKRRNQTEQTKFLFEQFGFLNEGDFDSSVLDLAENFGSLATTKAIQSVLNDISSCIGIKKIKFGKPRITELRKKVK